MKDNHDSNERRTFTRGIILAVVMALVLTAGILWFFVYTWDDGLIYPNVSALGVDLGGMTPEEAVAAIHAATDDTFSVQSLTINLPDTTLTLTPEQSGASLNVDGLVLMAYGYGRQGNRWENTQAKAEAALNAHVVDAAPFLTLRQDSIRQVLDQAAAAAASTLTQSTVTVTGQTPDLNLSYEKAMAKTDVVHQQLVIVMGTPDRSLDTEALMEAILAHYYANDYTPIDFSYSVTEPDALDLDALYAAHTISPVDAVLDESDYSITHETLGYGFVLDALKALVAAAGEGETVTVPFGYLPAAVTYESIDATLFQDVLGSVSTNHTNDSNRNTNLKLACKAINGKLIRPGETFSYNATLGERTEKKGYKPAGAYMAGKSVQTVGGGICQVSSTLYYACLKADLEIVERTAHGFTVSYMPYGMDATVSWGSLDYKFKNNTDYPIRIEAWVSDGQVHVKLIGTDTKDYYVKMTYETVDGPIEGKTVYEDYKWDNKEGYKDGDVIQTAYTG
ncbi:MAG: VanW family protein, partial [Oscillospiraceae bacterium]|nr:VanW family protein [Oscillospiraceae bacterium]